MLKIINRLLKNEKDVQLWERKNLFIAGHQKLQKK